MYITANDVMVYLGKSSLTVEETARINMLIAQSKAYLDSIIGDLTDTNRDFQVDYEFAYYKNGVIEFELPTNNITVFNSIEGVAYTDNYKVIGKRKSQVQLDKLGNYLVGVSTDDGYTSFKVNVRSGFAVIPEDIKLLQIMLVTNLLSVSIGGTVKMEKTGPHTIEYNIESDPYNLNKLLQSILNNYRSIYY